MVLYTILAVVFLCIGMAISVAAFGTGGKRKNIFKDIYFHVSPIEDGIAVGYTRDGNIFATLKIENPVLQNCADTDAYYDYISIFKNIITSLGEDFALQKHDVFCMDKYKDPGDKQREFLSESYFRYFGGRPYTSCTSYVTIVQLGKVSRFMAYDKKRWNDFTAKIRKVESVFRDSQVSAEFLKVAEMRNFVDRYFAVQFKDGPFSFNNFKVEDSRIEMGDRQFKMYSLIDIDQVGLPSMIRPYVDIEVNNASMPVDLMSTISKIPYADSVVYHQCIFIPGQRKELAALDKKKNRLKSMPDPGNASAAQDVEDTQAVIAKKNELLVYTHYSLLVSSDISANQQAQDNYLDNAFSKIGIHISKQANNQLELFVGSFPGNCFALSADYDRFLTLSDAACCLMYKESMKKSEETPCQVFYTDRQGVPVAIDIMGKEGKIKHTDNSNFFCLGPSGSGKSFHMNSVVRQLWEQDTDVVMVDTGNSYEGLCKYANGKYISYTNEKPITMNPFNVSQVELNIEKYDFLKNLILLIWKGADGTPSKEEEKIVMMTIEEYFEAYFTPFTSFTEVQKDSLRRTKKIEKSSSEKHYTSETELMQEIEQEIIDMERQRKALTVTSLSFNTFFEYASARIPDMTREHGIQFDIRSFRFMLAEFYRGGTYEKTLNEDFDGTLFEEKFIVFEIDNIKDHKTLFPLVTLIIMDVFIQKMRLKKNRKVLVIEEAWKAIASPLMADYIKYLYKTARKFWATVGVVTQEIQDIIGSPIVKEAIINNSDIVMLLDQSKFKERYDEIQAILGLTDVEKKKVFTINRLDNKQGRAFFKEIYIRRGTYGDVFGVEEPRECYMTYTTERSEKEALKIYEREIGGTIQAAIEQYCIDWNLSGIQQSMAFARKVNEYGRVLYLNKKKK